MSIYSRREFLPAFCWNEWVVWFPVVCCSVVFRCSVVSVSACVLWASKNLEHWWLAHQYICCVCTYLCSYTTLLLSQNIYFFPCYLHVTVWLVCLLRSLVIVIIFYCFFGYATVTICLLQWTQVYYIYSQYFKYILSWVHYTRVGAGSRGTNRSTALPSPQFQESVSMG